MHTAWTRIAIDGGGISSASIGAWYGTAFFRYHYMTVQVWGTFAGTYNVELTCDPNAILTDNYGNLAVGAEGHASAATIPSFIPTGFSAITTTGGFTWNNPFVAVRINVTAYTSGSIRAVAMMVP